MYLYVFSIDTTILAASVAEEEELSSRKELISTTGISSMVRCLTARMNGMC